MPTFDIKIDSNAEEVASIMARIGERIVHDARISAANRTMQQVQTQGRRELAGETGVPVRELSKRMKLHRANRSRDFARIFVGTLPIPAIRLGARQTSRGTSFRGAGGRVRADGAFISTMPSGHRGVFQRRGQRRLPIDEVKVSLAEQATRIFRRLMDTFAPGKFEELFRKDFEFRVGREAERQRAA